MKNILKGIGVSSGIGIGKPLIIENLQLTVSNRVVKKDEIELELINFSNIIKKGIYNIEKIIEKQTDESKIEIISAQIEILNDPSLISKVKEKIEKQQRNMEQAFTDVINEFLELFAQIDDEYLKARSIDVKDVYIQIMNIMNNIEPIDLFNIPQNSVIISNEITASQLISMNSDNIVGIITEEGSATSHVSIIANNMNIPAIVNVNSVVEQIKKFANVTVICDAESNQITITDEKSTIEIYSKTRADFYATLKKLDENKFLEAITKDGKKIKICSNVASEEEAQIALDKNADGVGLFRTEFLYMENTHFPTEAEQIKVYKKISEIQKNKEVIIRTLDIGGDKQLEYYDFAKEENPFLGCRAIRLCFKLPDIFKTQLRAILQSDVNNNIKIMLPMIISVDEFLKTKDIIKVIEKELKEENLNYTSNISLGVMIETPASVMIAEDLAKVCDFFSIGTNDLTQYILSVDRNNKDVAELYDTFHPAVLRCIKLVVDASHKYGKWTGVCGEFAGNTLATKILVGLGVDELSMSSNKISRIKDIILNSSYEECKKIAENALV